MSTSETVCQLILKGNPKVIEIKNLVKLHFGERLGAYPETTTWLSTYGD
jgi:hypothetical protein